MLTLILLFLTVVVALQVPAIQHYAVQKSVDVLSRELGTEVTLQKLTLTLSGSVRLDNLYIADQNNDTLWYSRQLLVRIDPSALINRHVSIQNIEIHGGRINMRREVPDFRYNFDFSGPQTPESGLADDSGQPTGIDTIPGDPPEKVIVTDNETGHPRPNQSQKNEPVTSDEQNNAGWRISLKRLALLDVDFELIDQRDGLYISAYAGNVMVRLKKSDLSAMEFESSQINIKNTTFRMTEGLAHGEAPLPGEPGEMPGLAIGPLNLQNVEFIYNNFSSAYGMELKVGRGRIIPKAVDIANLQFDLEQMFIGNSLFAWKTWEKAPFPQKTAYLTTEALSQSGTTSEDHQPDTVLDTPDSFPLFLRAEKLEIASFRFMYDDFSKARAPEGEMDYNHLDLTSLNLRTSDVNWNGRKADANIHQLQVNERSGFAIKELRTRLSIDDTISTLADLYLETNHSRIQDQVAISYPDLRAFANDYESLGYHISLNESYLDLAETFYFAPALRNEPLFNHNAGKPLFVNGKADGTLNDLTLDNLNLRGATLTEVSVSGRMQNLLDVNAMNFDLGHILVQSGKNDIRYLVPPEYMTDDVEFPERFSFTGGYSGTLSNFTTFGNFHSDLGILDGRLTMSLDERDEDNTYSGFLSAKDLDVGKISRMQDQLGKSTFRVVFDGKGLSSENMDAVLKGRITYLDALDYRYTRLDFDGRMRQEYFEGYAQMDDPNLGFNFEGLVDLSGELPKYDLELDLLRANLAELQLLSDTQSVSGNLVANLSGDHIDNLDGTLLLRDFVFTKPNLEYNLNRARLIASTREEVKSYRIDADFAEAYFEGNIELSTLPAALEEHLQYYFTLPGYDKVESASEQSFNFGVQVFETSLINDFFLPGMSITAPVNIDGQYQSQQKLLQITGKIPFISYGGNDLDSLEITVNSDHNQLDYRFYTTKYNSSAFKTDALLAEGSFFENILTTRLTIHDEERVPWFYVASSLEMEDSIFVFHLEPDDVMINYETWNIPEENEIRWGGSTFRIDNFRLRGPEAQLIRVQSKENDDSGKEVLDASIEEFRVENIMQILNVGNQDFVGKLSATFSMTDPLNQIHFEGQASLEDVSFEGYEAGNLALTFSKDANDDPYHFRADYQSKMQSGGSVYGNFIPGEEGGSLDVRLDAPEIFLDDFRGLALPHITRLQGKLAADIHVTGTLESPGLDGFLQLNDAGFSTPYSRAFHTFANERITFNRDRVNFENFVVVDTLNNRMAIDGNIAVEDIYEPVFNLRIDGNNFLLLHTSRQDNRHFFGTAFLDAALRVEGSIMEPSIGGRVRLRENSRFTVEVPDFEPEAIGYEEVVEFSPWKQGQMPEDEDEEKEGVKAFFRGVDADLTLEVDRMTRLDVIVDPYAGDYLRLFGGGTVSIGVDRTGELTLAGSYDIAEGNYQLTFYDVVRRRFEIRPGSNIIWSGDPLDADLDISAIYTQRTSAAGLFPASSAGGADAYRQTLPFQVYLNMEGKLMQPRITFMIDMPTEHRAAAGGAIYGRIQEINENESERNKQVFALLILNQFLPESPLESPGSGPSIAGGARSSASRLLTQQLNQLSGRYIRGVDLAFDVESYEGLHEGDPEGRTELQMEVSRRFFDERVEIRVGSHMDIEGDRRRETGFSDFTGDVVIEYRLTEDGRLRMTGFRQHQYGNIIDGEYVESGVSLRFGRDFHTFRKLFKRKENEEEKNEDEE